MNTYKVTFVNYDDSVLQSSNVAYGSLPAYKGLIPTKPDTPDHRFEFKGWTPALAKVTGQATYKAVFDAVKKTSPDNTSPDNTSPEKASQTISAKKTVTKVVKVPAKAKMIKKTKGVNLKKLAKVSARTTVSFKKANKVGGGKIAVAKSGKVKLKKGLKVGTYKLKVKLSAPGNGSYKAAKPKTIIMKISIQ